MYWVLVNYYSQEDIHHLILSVKSFSFIVVDNSKNYQAIEDEVVLKPEKNLGYIGGFQHAIKYLETTTVDYSTLVFSNSDISFTKEMVDSLRMRSASVEVIIPNIVNLDGVSQNPHILTRRPKAFWIIRRVFASNPLFWFIWLSLYNWKKGFRKTNRNISNDLVYSGHGSFYIFRNVCLKSFAEEKYNFLYGEEVHIAEYCLTLDIPIRFNREIKITHAEHATTAKIPSHERLKRFRESYDAILEKYYT